MTPEEDKEVRGYFENGGTGYGDIKTRVAEILNNYFRDMRERRKELARNPKKAIKLLEKGNQQAYKVAEEKMTEIRKKVGFTL